MSCILGTGRSIDIGGCENAFDAYESGAMDLLGPRASQNLFHELTSQKNVFARINHLFSSLLLFFISGIFFHLSFVSVLLFTFPSQKKLICESFMYVLSLLFTSTSTHSSSALWSWTSESDFESDHDLAIVLAHSGVGGYLNKKDLGKATMTSRLALNI